MVGLRISQIGRNAATILLLGALVFPQTIDSEKSLLWCLPAYGTIAIALLIAAATAGLDFQRDILCLATSLAFIGYIAMRALISPAPYFARADLYCALGVLALYGLTVSVIKSAAFRLAVLVSLLAFAVFHVLAGLVQFGVGENFMAISFLQNFDVSLFNRASGLYADPDHLAGLLEVLGIFGLSITCWSRLPSWAKVVIGYLTLNCYLGAALTGSRGAFVSIIASLIVFAGLSAIVLRAGGASFFRKYGAIGLIGLTVVLVAGGFLIYQSPPLKRLTRISAIDPERLGLWNAAIEQWRLAPVVGTGSGTYLFYGRQFRAEKMQLDPVDVHNDYLHLLCEYGLVGALLFLAFFFAHLRQGCRSFLRLGPERLAKGSLPFSNRLALNIGAIAAIGAYVVHSVVDFNLHIPANALLLAFVFGMVANPDIELSPGNSRFRLALPVKIAFMGAAIILLSQCVRLFPGEYYAGRALTALQDENHSTAISYANEALKWEQRNPKIFFYLGRAFGALGNDEDRIKERIPNYDAALAAFDRARFLAPLEVGYPLSMAYAYDQIGRFAEAEWMYGIARSLDPRSVSISQMYQSHIEAWKTLKSEKLKAER